MGNSSLVTVQRSEVSRRKCHCERFLRSNLLKTASSPTLLAVTRLLPRTELLPSLTAKKAQSIIETSLILVAAIAFLLGAFRIGLWYNNELAERQSAYQNSRVEAGSSTTGKWPVYARRGLTEEWVLGGGEFPPEGTLTGGGGGSGRTRNKECEAPAEAKESQARENYKRAAILRFEADDLEAQATNDDATADYWEGEYNTCFTNCKASCWEFTCDDEYCATTCSYYQEQEDYYRGEAERKRTEAAQKRTEADNLETEAEGLYDEAKTIRQDCWKIKE